MHQAEHYSGHTLNNNYLKKALIPGRLQCSLTFKNVNQPQQMDKGSMEQKKGLRENAGLKLHIKRQGELK